MTDAEVDVGDIAPRQACNFCGYGIMTIDWDMK